jgi:integrase
MLTLLARLGLRAGEVAALALDDIDWRAGEITVRGKGSRAERLPLPAEVISAVLHWANALKQPPPGLLGRGGSCSNRRASRSC